MAKIQPKSPQDEGVDPLTKGETLYPREDTKKLSEELAAERDKTVAEENQTDENSRGAADPKSSEPAETEGSETSKPQTTESKTSSR